jgi:hypothetical protein
MTNKKSFEDLGPEALRLRINDYRGELRRSAQIWLLEKDAEAALARWRSHRNLLWASIAITVCILFMAIKL